MSEIVYDGVYYFVILVFAGLAVWAVVHDLKKQIQTGHKGHFRSPRNPVVSNLELFETFNPQKKEDAEKE